MSRDGPERKAKVAELTAQRIGEQILERGLLPGDALPNERDMAEELGVGRTTLREALRLLETQGVLRIKPGPGGGPQVRQPQPGDLVGTMTLLLQFMGATMVDAIVAWTALEPVVASLAAEHASDAQVEALQERVDRMRAALDDDTFYVENYAFHTLLAETAGNTVLLVVLETIKRVTAGLYGVVEFPREVRQSLVVGCQQIADAVGDHDATAAAAAAAALLTALRGFVRDAYPHVLDAPLRWVPGGR